MLEKDNQITKADWKWLELAAPENTEQIPANEILSVYFRQMAAESLLTAEEEVRLAKWMEVGREAQTRLLEDDLGEEEREELGRQVERGSQARDKLARANTRLVIEVAKKYQDRGLSLEDMIQEGNLGLMWAVDRFDHRLGNRFSTFAYWWIRQKVTRALRQKVEAIRVPLHTAEKWTPIADELARMRAEEGYFSEEVIAKRLRKKGVKIDSEGVSKLLLTRWMWELDRPLGDDSQETVGDRVEDPEADVVEAATELLMREELRQAAKEILSEFGDKRRWLILKLRFGIVEEGDEELNHGGGMTLEEIGQILGLSRERVRQLEGQAMRMLKFGLGKKIKDYL